ncbi:arabinosylfuranosidase ArfA [Parasphaerochaeta coccoides]|uniref:non-reducing end alpha-L-arabinofuranosidase n=1 Tax=Parasphaerochaeta coccoides (strain ATCC BAA-1237 / DSM 17374 / SPN1) TaxID=760011 RepID=F4GHN2_PARC1|nr:alpha-N-arabinofuranosidase [Parasphaerochaeta coccoides]AEC01570.1 Alpha-N-arabinofuranosidase [Parasphaerochaeta coccoides DSM 17374]
MDEVRVCVEKAFTLAQVDERLFSSFIEHLGRAIYTGIYEPGHPLADEQGFRTDVIDFVKDLRVPLIRYPGGNFLSGYRWMDGIGPKEKRPVRLDVAWKTLEPNEIGIGEFYDWTRKVGSKVMGSVNMGTGTVQDAADFFEYCNYPGGTYLSDLRRQNGHDAPFDIRTWCIGNEMDGHWQICHLDAADYGKKALETIKMLKWIDPQSEAVVCGSSSGLMKSFPEWDRIVLEHTYEKADFISLHRYYENFDNDDDFLASFVELGTYIKAAIATADYVKALKRSAKTMYLSLDEWNVWYQRRQEPHDWQKAPSILEDHYSLLDALVVGGLGLTLLNNANRVKIACLAQLVNVIAPIFTKEGGSAIRQTIYYPFRDISLHGRGVVLTPVVHGPKKETKYGDCPLVETAVIHDEEGKTVTVFCLNTGKNDLVEFTLDMRSFGKLRMSFWTCLTGKDLSAENTFEKPNAVNPRNMPVEKTAASTFSITLPPLSWNVMKFAIVS